MSPGKSVGEYFGLDPFLESSMRLAIMTLLAEPLASEGLAHRELVSLTALTQGNLGSHVSVLCEAGYVESRKDSVDNRPRTTYKLTPEGRRALLQHQLSLSNLPAMLNLRLQNLKLPLTPSPLPKEHPFLRRRA